MEDKEARESNIARKIEGADRLEKIEISESWKSQRDYCLHRCRGIAEC